MASKLKALDRSAETLCPSWERRGLICISLRPFSTASKTQALSPFPAVSQCRRQEAQQGWTKGGNPPPPGPRGRMRVGRLSIPRPSHH